MKSKKKIDWDVLIEDIHDNAIAHGWWEEAREPHEIIALIHSELSEALEEYRAGRPMVWWQCRGIRWAVENGCKDINGMCSAPKDCPCRTPKPEGIAVELIDAVIRILDWYGHMDVHFDLDDIPRDDKHVSGYTLPMLICREHMMVSNAWSSENDEIASILLDYVIADIVSWLEANDVEWEDVMTVKCAYNKHRPYRHGDKRL